MEIEDRDVVLDVIQGDDSSTILFHSSDNPYWIQYCSIDENWKNTPLRKQECRFLPKSIKAYKNQELVIVHSGISASILNTVFSFFGFTCIEH